MAVIFSLNCTEFCLDEANRERRACFRRDKWIYHDMDVLLYWRVILPTTELDFGVQIMISKSEDD